MYGDDLPDHLDHADTIRPSARDFCHSPVLCARRLVRMARQACSWVPERRRRFGRTGYRPWTLSDDLVAARASPSGQTQTTLTGWTAPSAVLEHSARHGREVEKKQNPQKLTRYRTYSSPGRSRRAAERRRGTQPAPPTAGGRSRRARGRPTTGHGPSAYHICRQRDPPTCPQAMQRCSSCESKRPTIA